MEENKINEIDAVRELVNNSSNVFNLIEACKEWREVLLNRFRIKFRHYQYPLSDKIIEYAISRGALGNEITTLWCRQSGKTEDVADTALTLGTFFVTFLNENFNVGLFAPVESMITHVTRNRLRQRFKKVKSWMEHNAGVKQIAGEGITSSLFILENQNNGKEFGARSLSVGERAETIGETFELMIIEQSELVNAMKLKNDVFPMGATTGGVRVMTGTTSPYFKNEYFKQAVERWSNDPLKNKSTSDYLDIVDYKEASKHSIAYRRYVSKERKKFGEDSIEFRTQYGLEWVGTALKFVGWEKIVNQEVDYTWDKERLRFVGIDVARAGDSTVVTIIEIDGTEIHIIAWLELEGLDFENQIINITKFLQQYKPVRYMLVDVPGMGVAIYDMLKSRVWEKVPEEEWTEDDKKEFRITNKPILRQWAIVDGYYGSKNENDIMFKALDREAQHDRIFFPKHTKYTREKSRFIDQLLDLERKYSGNTLKLQAPQVKGRHDDYPLSLALAIYALKEKSFNSGVSSLNI